MKKILIVGDEDLSLLFQSILSKCRDKLEMKICTKGQKAVQVAKYYKPHLIIVVGITIIPGIWGFILIKELRRRKCFDSTKILLCSAKDSYGRRACNMGVDAFLPKPFDVREARYIILNLFESRC